MKLLTQWAVTSSALILIVLAVRWLFRKKLSARLKYALWGVVLLRLLIPFQVELPAPVSDSLPVLASNLAQDVTPRLDDTMLYAIPTEEQPYGLPAGMPPEYIRNGPFDSAWDRFSGGTVYDGEHITRYAFMMTALEVVVLIWLAGTALAALVILTSNLRFARRLRKRRTRLEGVDAPIPVYVAEGLPSPCLFGVFRPAVYVTPQAADDPDALRHVLAHELTHYAHKDHIWSLLRCLALALHWYDPLAWLAVGLSKQDGELACDEGAVARLGEEERIPYGRTLVNMVAARSLRPGDLLSCSTAMTGGGKSVKRRVAQIVKKPETVKAALFAVIALVALSAIFVFAGRAQPQPSPTFLSLLEQTTAIRYIPTIYSSGNYPVPITDEELLAQAKERLSTFTYLSEDEPYPDLSRLGPHQNPKIVLTCGEQETVYTLMWQNNYTYLFPGDLWEQQEELRKEEGETAQLQGVSGTMRSRPGDRVFSAVSELALLQIRKNEKNMITPSDTPELEEFFAQLETAQSIYVGQPMISSANPPGLISDPAALARAKELLGKASAPLQLPEGVTREEFWESIRPYLSSTEYQDMEVPPSITQEDLEDMLFIRGNPILLCPGPEPTPDAEYRYWLADNNLLQWDAELEENPIKLLATFSEDVYSQLAELARTNKDPLRAVLLGQAQFQFVGEDGTIRPMDIHSVPSLFSPSSSYAALGEFAVVDLDGDGEREVVVHTSDVGNDLTGYLVLRRENGEIYGYPSGWRTFWNLKADGTFDYSLWNGSEEGTGSYRFDRSDFSSSFHNRLVLEKHFQAEGPGNGADLDTLVIDGKGVTEEAYQKAAREQRAKPDATWYDFTEVNIRAMFP